MEKNLLLYRRVAQSVAWPLGRLLASLVCRRLTPPLEKLDSWLFNEKPNATLTQVRRARETSKRERERETRSGTKGRERAAQQTHTFGMDAELKLAILFQPKFPTGFSINLLENAPARMCRQQAARWGGRLAEEELPAA